MKGKQQHKTEISECAITYDAAFLKTNHEKSFAIISYSIKRPEWDSKKIDV